MSMMNMYLAAADAAGAGAGGAGTTVGMIVFYVVIIGAMMYFMAIRPQKKQQKTMNEMNQALEVGDSVCTTSGFYGVVVDIKEDVVVIEFGSNRNCRIPMKKAAIQAVEKPDGTTISL